MLLVGNKVHALTVWYKSSCHQFLGRDRYHTRVLKCRIKQKSANLHVTCLDSFFIDDVYFDKKTSMPRLFPMICVTSSSTCSCVCFCGQASLAAITAMHVSIMCAPPKTVSPELPCWIAMLKLSTTKSYIAGQRSNVSILCPVAKQNKLRCKTSQSIVSLTAIISQVM